MNFAPAARVPRVSFEADDRKENKKYGSLLYLAALNTGSSRVTNQPTSVKKNNYGFHVYSFRVEFEYGFRPGNN